MNNLIKVVIAEDNEFFRKGVISVLNEIDTVKLVGEAANGKELIDLLTKVSTDIVLTDIKMPVLDGIDAAKWIKIHYPEIKILMLSLHGEEQYLKKIVEIGASGFILKNTTKDNLERVLNLVMEGKLYFSEEFMPFFTQSYLPINNSKNGDNLTLRELEILQEIAEGLTNKEIAEKLSISIKTVINHRTNIMAKAGAKNTASLIRYGIKNKLIVF